ncbi:hypothetical protein MRX96_015158 [Rhipicephalus microplus]
MRNATLITLKPPCSLRTRAAFPSSSLALLHKTLVRVSSEGEGYVKYGRARLPIAGHRSWRKAEQGDRRNCSTLIGQKEPRMAAGESRPARSANKFPHLAGYIGRSSPGRRRGETIRRLIKHSPRTSTTTTSVVCSLSTRRHATHSPRRNALTRAPSRPQPCSPRTPLCKVQVKVRHI